jgi:hypothetical protein
MQQPAQLGLPVKKHGPFAAAVGRQRRRQRPSVSFAPNAGQARTGKRPCPALSGLPVGGNHSRHDLHKPPALPDDDGMVTGETARGSPSRNGPNIHNRYLIAADICGETGAGREGSPAARETPAMDGRVNKRATIIRHHIMILSYYRRHCACSQESRAPVSSLAGGPGARRSAQAHHANRRTGERRNAFHNALWELARHGASPARRG